MWGVALQGWAPMLAGLHRSAGEGHYRGYDQYCDSYICSQLSYNNVIHKTLLNGIYSEA